MSFSLNRLNQVKFVYVLEKCDKRQTFYGMTRRSGVSETPAVTIKTTHNLFRLCVNNVNVALNRSGSLKHKRTRLSSKVTSFNLQYWSAKSILDCSMSCFSN